MVFRDKNRELLTNKYPELQRLIAAGCVREEVDGELIARYRVLPEHFPGAQDLPAIEVFASRSGTPSARLVPVDSPPVLLHSSFDPLKEAARFADNNSGKKTLLAVYGLGLGYQCLTLADTLQQGQTMLILEPNPAVLCAAFDNNDLSPILNHSNIHLIVGPNKLPLSSLLEKSLNLINLTGLEIIEHRPTVQVYPDFFKETGENLRRVVNNLYLNFATTFKDSPKWVQNTIANLPYLISSPRAFSLQGKFKGTPAVIVAAGPSLDKNIEYLRLLKGKALIIAVGTSLKPLMARDIIPDIACSVDPNEANYRHFQGFKEKETVLAFDPISYPPLVSEYPGPRMAFKFENAFCNWLEPLTGPMGRVESGGSVATVATFLAVLFGCSPVIFIGQDLAFSGGRTHAGDTVYDFNRVQFRENDLNHLTVPGYFGGEVFTERTLYNYLAWFEKFIAANPETAFINATEGGALIRGAKRYPLKQVVCELASSQGDAATRLQDFVASFMPPSSSKVREHFIEMINLLKETEKDSSEILRLLQKALNKGLTEEEGIRIEKLEARLKANKKAMKLVDMLIMPTILRLMKALQTSKGRENLMCNAELYTAVVEGTGYIRKGLADSLRRCCQG